MIENSNLERLEHHRNGLVLLPDTSDNDPGAAFFIFGDELTPNQMWCSCKTTSNNNACRHMLELSEIIKKLKGRRPYEEFKNSFWYVLANMLDKQEHDKPEMLKAVYLGQEENTTLRILSSKDRELVVCNIGQEGEVRLLERLNAVLEERDESYNRFSALESLIIFTRSEWEAKMVAMGGETIGMSFEASAWHRLAYHFQRELGEDGLTFSPLVDEKSGEFKLAVEKTSKNNTGQNAEKWLLQISIPRKLVKNLLKNLSKRFPDQRKLRIHPIPLKSIFKINRNTKLDLELREVIESLQENGEKVYLERSDFEKFRYGDLVYVKEMGVLAELEKETGKTRKFKAPKCMTLKESSIPSFLDEYSSEINNGSIVIETSLKKRKIFKEIDRIIFDDAVIDRDWCWLSVNYGFGNEKISLERILKSMSSGIRYLSVHNGWIDCNSSAFDELRNGNERRIDDKGRVRFKTMEALRLQSEKNAVLGGDESSRTEALDKLFNLQPLGKKPSLDGMKSKLRIYQEIGLDWLRFLYENSLGGLLCDDMGLGKTHQIMALFTAIKEVNPQAGPFLVICPTSVLSHWKNKIRDHAVALKADIYHGNQRNLDRSLKKSDVTITSYGVMRNDSERLAKAGFDIAVFDEIQAVKNKQTIAYEAAENLKAKIKLGLTGTPVENNLGELKALFDLVLPGYLGDDKSFEENYGKKQVQERKSQRLERLSRQISPFVLRRMKTSVLQELPPKIEDVRYCELTDDQVKLYRDAIETQGAKLKRELGLNSKPVPYIHIFALLNLLKQICDHPALAIKDDPHARKLKSGKWESFKELLGECLDSGRKIVVYSQFLEMIDIIGKHLDDLGVGYVTLTGKSRKREEILERFAEDDDCRVFVGSLKAGGVGIDLVAASVVIHYDRWWNAAKEDQATDRVHRFGQQRGVQVFKFVTEGTLEEKISAIIDKKRHLLEDVVGEDDPDRMKTFSREELLDLMSAPM